MRYSPTIFFAYSKPVWIFDLGNQIVFFNLWA
jgi:hypothetical protein